MLHSLLSILSSLFSSQTPRPHLYPKYCILALALAILLFASGLNNYFCSDDWPALLRNMQPVLREIPSWFTGLRVGSYRPLHDVFVALCWHLFGLTLWPYRLISIGLYALTAANTGYLAYLLTNDTRTGGVALVLFSILAPHAEPVLWFAATNELLAALCMSTAAVTYLVFRTSGRWRWFGIAWVGCGLALMSKETALLLPLMLPGYDVLRLGLARWGIAPLQHAPQVTKTQAKAQTVHLNDVLPWLCIGTLWVAFLLFRLPMGSAYTSAVSFDLPRLLMNGVYYLLIGVFALPNNYAFLTSAPAWLANPMLPLVVLGSSILVLTVTGWLWMRTRAWRMGTYVRSLLFAIAWSGLGLAPVVFIVAERSIFLSSIGIALALAIGLVGAWRKVRQLQSPNDALWRALTTGAILLCIGVNTCVLLYRSAWFDRSATVSQTVFEQLDTHLANSPPGEHIVLINLPDYIAHTFTFRNTFPAATQVLGYDYEITAVLDTTWATLTPQAQTESIKSCQEDTDCTVLRYNARTLRLEE